MGGSDILACGLFAFSSTNAQNWNTLTRYKFEVLGVENDVRGGDGCGISYDNLVDKSEEVKKFDDFWRLDRVPSLLEYPVIIGHDRKASVGAKTYDNTQPIFFPGETDPIGSILAHNGTLLNHEELYKKHKAEAHFGLDTSKMSDSQMLALLIERIGWQILNEYIGAAAILYMNANERGVMYVYHGESIARKGVVVTSEERPLFFAKDSENIWFCSTRAALEKIVMDKTSIDVVPTNKVFRVEGNTMTEVFAVNRSACYQYEYTAATYANDDYDYDYSRSYNGGSWYDKNGRSKTKDNKKDYRQTALQLPPFKPTKLSEDNTPYKPANTVYYERGFMCADGQPLDGMIRITRTGAIDGNPMNVGYNFNKYTFYFWKGNLMKGRDEYIAAIIYSDQMKGVESESTILKNIAVNFVYPFVVPENIGGDDDIMYDNEINKTSKTCDSRFYGTISPVLTCRELMFGDGKLLRAYKTDKYIVLDTILVYQDLFSEEFLEWEKEYKEAKDIEIKEEVKDSINNEKYECPDCMGTGYEGKEFCPVCEGTRVVDNEYINEAMVEEFKDNCEYIATLVEEGKITMALSDIVDEGILLLEEPEYASRSKNVLNKLKDINKILKDGRYNSTDV